jgi:glycine/D-amino acid oxidase-like deaminating enzyme
VIFATNGFLPENLRQEFAGRTLPVISAIVVTRPLRDDERRAQRWASDDVFVNSRRVLNYFRLLPDRRFLFGGRGASDGSAAGAEQAFAELARTFRRVWPAWQDVSVDYRWHGLICMTASAAPCIGRLDDDASVYFGFGYHGNGVNNATWAGRQLADWLGRGNAPASLPRIVRGLGKRYPFPGLRRSYLRLALGVARQLDRL